jgi:hypothetical protein
VPKRWWHSEDYLQQAMMTNECHDTQASIESHKVDLRWLFGMVDSKGLTEERQLTVTSKVNSQVRENVM